MPYKKTKILIRVDCTPITDTKSFAEKIREIPGFRDMFSDFNYFKVKETSNYRNGTTKGMDPNDLVIRYSKSDKGIGYLFDITSRFYYVRAFGDNLPDDNNNLFAIIEAATKKLIEEDSYVRITNYAAGYGYEEKKEHDEGQNNVDKVERDSYMSRFENIKIITQSMEKVNSNEYVVAAIVNDVVQNPNYNAGKKMFNRDFMTALSEALNEASKKYAGYNQ